MAYSSANMYSAPPDTPSEHPPSTAHHDLQPYSSAESDTTRPTYGKVEQQNIQQPGHKAVHRSFKALLKSYNTPNQLALLAVIVIQAAVVLTMLGLITHIIDRDTPPDSPKVESVTVYLGIFILAEAFEFFIVLDALRLKNVIQLWSCVGFSTAMTVYAALIGGQINRAVGPFNENIYPQVRPYVIVMPIVLGVATICLIFLTWRLYLEFGWNLFQQLGADLQIKRMYMTYMVFVCLLKSDFFWFMGFTLQFVILVTQIKRAELIITIIAFPLTAVFLILAALGVRWEKRWLMYLTFFIEACGLAYFVFKLYRLYQPSQEFRYGNVRRSLGIFSAISIVMLLATIFFQIRCFENFGKGLGESIPKYWSTESKKKQRRWQKASHSESGTGNLEANESRMSLD